MKTGVKVYEVMKTRNPKPPYEKRLAWFCTKNQIKPDEEGWSGFFLPEAGSASRYPEGTTFVCSLTIPNN